MKNCYSSEMRDENDLPDIEIWKKLKEGNIVALKILFLRHHDHLLNYGLKLSGNRYLVEDCIHNLFFRLWKRRRHLGKVQSVRSYLWISFRRSLFKSMNDGEREMLTDTIQKYSPEIRFNSEELIIRNERKAECSAALERALNQLPDRQKEAIFLKYFNGLGYDEIQEVMSINYQTARNYIYSGVEALKDYFESEEKELIPHRFSLIFLCLLI